MDQSEQLTDDKSPITDHENNNITYHPLILAEYEEELFLKLLHSHKSKYHKSNYC